MTFRYFLFIAIIFLIFFHNTPLPGQVNNIPQGVPNEFPIVDPSGIENIEISPVSLPERDPWSHSGEFTVNFQQVALSNWAGGGEGSIAIGSLANFGALYDDLINRWETNFEIAYGVNRQGGEKNRFIKTDDNILLMSSYGRKITPNVDLSSVLDFRTQVAQGFDYVEAGQEGETTDPVLISRFMSPAYLKAHIGLTYYPEAGNNSDNSFSMSLSPFAGKFTIVADDVLVAKDLFGVEPGKNIRAEGGSNLSIALHQNIVENIRIKSNLDLFSNIEKFQNVDVNFQALLYLRVNDYIKSTISSQLIYDDDINITRDDGSVGPAIQFKNVINVGFSVTL